MPAVLEFLVIAASALSVSAYAGGPVNTTRFCGASQAVSSGTYTLINNIWGPKLDNTNPVGFQCANFVSRNGNTSVAFNINYQWTLNKGFVKGYTNMQQNDQTGHKIYNIYSIPSTWNYSVNVNSNLDYNIAYDFYTARTNSLTAAHTNEIMIWLSSQYMKPTSSHVNASNKSVPIFSNISIAGYTWDLYQGVGGTGLNAAGLNVLSFYNTGPARTHFTGDLKLFFSYLLTKKLILGTDYLNVIGGGSEVIKADNTTIKSTYFAINVIPDVVFPSSTVKPSLSTSIKTSTSTKKTTSTSTKKTTSTSTKKSTSTAKTTAKATSSTKKTTSTAKATSVAKK